MTYSNLALIFMLGFLSGAWPITAHAADASPWHTDYARARAEARRTGKPLFVVFRCQP